MLIWHKSHYGAWHLYGHSHGNLPDDPTSLSIDVGVDCHNYFPISFDEIKDIMARKTFVPIDHHGRAKNQDAPISGVTGPIGISDKGFGLQKYEAVGE